MKKNYTIGIDSEVMAAIQKRADGEHRPLQNYIEWILRAVLEMPEVVKPVINVNNVVFDSRVVAEDGEKSKVADQPKNNKKVNKPVSMASKEKKTEAIGVLDNKTPIDEVTEVIVVPVVDNVVLDEKPVKNDDNNESKTKPNISWNERQERLNNFKKNNGLF